MHQAYTQCIRSHDHVSGSECIKRIRNALDPDQEMRMLALVRSANDSSRDLALYSSKAHGVMSKVPLQRSRVRETVCSLWRKRFPREEGAVAMPPSVSVENFPDFSVSTVELLTEVEKIDEFFVQNPRKAHSEQWPLLWDKLHQLKGDLKSANEECRLTAVIDLIESLRDGDRPSADFMSTWLRIRSDVVLFISQKG